MAWAANPVNKHFVLLQIKEYGFQKLTGNAKEGYRRFIMSSWGIYPEQLPAYWMLSRFPAQLEMTSLKLSGPLHASEGRNRSFSFCLVMNVRNWHITSRSFYERCTLFGSWKVLSNDRPDCLYIKDLNFIVHKEWWLIDFLCKCTATFH